MWAGVTPVLVTAFLDSCRAAQQDANGVWASLSFPVETELRGLSFPACRPQLIMRRALKLPGAGVAPLSLRILPMVTDSESGSLPDLLLSECRASDPLFAELVSSAAREANVDPRALGVRALLHLPRVATFGGRVTRAQVERELFHSARLLRKDAADVQALIPDSKFALQELIFSQRALTGQRRASCSRRCTI